MAETTKTTTNGNTSVTTVTPDAPKKLKGIDVNNDGTVDVLDDLNGDGKANQKDVDLRRDTISMEVLKTDYNTAYQIVAENDELRQIFKDAIRMGYSNDQFTAATRNTQWYKDQGSDYARTGWLAKAAGGKDWEDQLDQAEDVVQRTASSMGAVLNPAELRQYAEKYIMGGWFVPQRQGLMADSLAGLIDANKGSAGQTSTKLKDLARLNGVKLSDQWVTDVTRSIARGDTTIGDQETWIRTEAEKRFPMFAEQIRAGVSVRALASPYLGRMQDILEIPEEMIKLDDPFIVSALGSVDAKGQQTGMSYNDFETKLRNDPRWEKTTNGKNILMNNTDNFMKSMGFSTDDYFSRG